MRIRQNFFSGERPRVATHLSKEYEAQVAENCDLSRGDLRPFRANARIQNLTESGTLRPYTSGRSPEPTSGSSMPANSISPAARLQARPTIASTSRA